MSIFEEYAIYAYWAFVPELFEPVSSIKCV